MTVSFFPAGAEIPWPENENGEYARAYLTPLMSAPSEFVANVGTTYGVVIVDGEIVLPVTINDGDYENSYVCSPYAHYVTYAKEELRMLDSPLLRGTLAGALSTLGLWLRFCDINRVILVNNWLLSTNLYPALTGAQIAKVSAFLRARFVNHAIAFCSVNSSLSGACGDLLLVPGRQIALARPADHPAKQRRRWWRDYLLIDRRGYRIVEPGPADVPRIVELYNMLYLDKYSRNNPQFTERFIAQTRRSGTISYLALSIDGRIDGVLGYFVRDGVLTTPIFGYDTALPQKVGLYRMLGGILYDTAAQKGWLLNDSSGAAEFKRLRGAVADIEFRAVDVRHLAWRRRMGWRVLATLLHRVAVPLVRRYEL